MSEELVVTDPEQPPAPPPTTRYKVVTIFLNRGRTSMDMAIVQITLTDDVGGVTIAEYTGPEAEDLMKWLNTANFSVNSMNKKILQKLSNDGKLPPGTVEGTPDPPAGDTPDDQKNRQRVPSQKRKR